MKDLFSLSEKEQVEFLKKYHYTENMSITDIASRLNTYTNKIRRLAAKLGFSLRDKSEAQKNAIKTGKTKPPMEGKTHSKQTKNKMKDNAQAYWASLTPEEMKEREETSRANWEKFDDEFKKDMFKKAGQAKLKTTKQGSKLEHEIKERLIKEGYKVSIHQKHILSNEKLEIDLFIHDLSVAIECDGPTHFLPIYGEEQLEIVKKRDKQKDGLVLSGGCCLIRVRQAKNLSNLFVEKSWGKLHEILKNIEAKFPPQGQRFFIIEE
jgi:very-short-patch-repair endonuclease